MQYFINKKTYYHERTRRRLEVDVKEDLRAGRLIELLPEHAAPPSPLQLLFPPARAQPRRVQAFAQHLVETFSESLSHPQ